jgi:hypothetical protein
VFDHFFFAERAKFIDGADSANVFFADESERQFAKRRGGNVDPEFTIVVASHFSR